MDDFLPIFQIIISVVLIALILLQQRGTALGSAFGQESGGYSTRRGMQKKIFYGTIVAGVLFMLSALANLLLR